MRFYVGKIFKNSLHLSKKLSLRSMNIIIIHIQNVTLYQYLNVVPACKRNIAIIFEEILLQSNTFLVIKRYLPDKKKSDKNNLNL